MRYLRIILLAGTVFALALSATLVLLTRESDVPIGGPFTLTNTDGKQVTESDFRGRLMLVFFGFTNCPDICPTELSTIAKALDRLGTDAAKVAPVFISVDPERDTPEVIAGYVKNIDSRIVGLTGKPSEVSAAAKAYRVYFRKADAKPGSTDYMVDHSGFTYLMDGRGRYLTHFTFNTPAETMVTVIKKHLF